VRNNYVLQPAFSKTPNQQQLQVKQYLSHEMRSEKTQATSPT